jgi:hypothetical protein
LGNSASNSEVAIDLVGHKIADMSLSPVGILSSFMATAAICSMENCVISVVVGIGTGEACFEPVGDLAWLP